MKNGHNRQEDKTKVSDELTNELSDGVDLGMKSDMTILSQVSHEIRTPLTAIFGYAEMILKHASSLQESREAASVILDNSDYLLRILDDLLEADNPSNRISGGCGELSIRKQQLDILRLLQGVYKMFSNAAIRKGLYFTLSYSTPIPRIILTDMIRVRQVLINLISNAIKFTLTGGVCVNVSWQNDNMSDVIFVTGVIKIDVCDSGIGISPEVLPCLFVPYFQADQTIRACFGGTGLGLAISKKIANKLGGEIKVTNNPNGGTTFSFLLPVLLEGDVEFVSDPLSEYSGIINNPKTTTKNINIKNNAKNTNNSKNSNVTKNFIPTKNTGNTNVEELGKNNNAGMESDAGSEPQTLTGQRILLVDDSDEVRRLFGLILTKAGAAVKYAENGELAFDLASRENFDVILMDISLPFEDGYSVSQRLRNNGYRGQIIAITGDDSLECKNKARQAGCNTFVTKPIFRNELIKIVNAHKNK
ncbi:MAG: response regulator [Planctomycetaceae bacterium]|nr:response regulator [Planctomycetaceae bacterium]